VHVFAIQHTLCNELGSCYFLHSAVQFGSMFISCSLKQLSHLGSYVTCLCYCCCKSVLPWREKHFLTLDASLLQESLSALCERTFPILKSELSFLPFVGDSPQDWQMFPLNFHPFFFMFTKGTEFHKIILKPL